MTVRQEMESVINDGLSVMYRGNVYSTLESLPSEAELAEGDEALTNAYVDALKGKIEALEAERARLSPTSEVADEEEVVKAADTPTSDNQKLTDAIKRGPGRRQA